jgi:O-antigen ligase
VRALAAASAPFMVYVILLTDSRLGLVGTFVTIALFLLLWGAHRWWHVKQSLVGASIFFGYPAALGAMIGVILFVGRIRRHFFGAQYQDSNDGRNEMYSKGIPMILQHPWGYGSGNGAVALGITNPAGDISIDTYYMSIGLDYGVLGFLFYYGAVLAAGYYAARPALLNPGEKRDIAFLGPLAISLASFLVSKSVFSQEDNNPLVFMMMGAIAALCSRLETTKVASSPSPTD